MKNQLFKIFVIGFTCLLMPITGCEKDSKEFNIREIKGRITNMESGELIDHVYVSKDETAPCQ